MYSFDTVQRVRYGETDKMGYLYYGRYLDYYEIGRVEMLRSLGLDYRRMEDELGVMLPVVSVEVNYKKPLYYDDIVTIRTTLHELPDKLIVFHVELLRPDGVVANIGIVRLCFIRTDTRRPVRAPEFLLELLRPYFEGGSTTK